MNREDLEPIVRLLAERTGLRIGPRQHAWLLAAVTRVVERLGHGPVPNVALLVRRHDFVEQLIDEVTIRETFFMRQSEQLRAIDWRLAMEAAAAAGRDEVRIWSAGCASGEEAYTLALLASESLGPEAPVSVLGTDISAEALSCARRGWYTGRTVRRLEHDVLTRHFQPEEGGISVQPRLRRLVAFRRHNLVLDGPPVEGEHRFDVVVCRNVLIHFEPSAAERAGATLMAGLSSEGTLLLAPADRLCLSRSLLGAAPLRGDEPAPRRRILTTRAPSGQRERRPARAAAAATAPATAAGRSVLSDPDRPAERPAKRPAERLVEAMRLADEQRLDEALAVAHRAAEESALDAASHMVTGMLEMAVGAPDHAVASLRRAMYLDPSSAIAAFHLGRAREATGDRTAAREAYERALHALDPDDHRFDWLLDPLDVVDVAEACKLRLLELREL